MPREHNTVPRLDGHQLDSDDGYAIASWTSSTSIVSEPINVARWSQFMMVAEAPDVGSPNGTIKVQGCIDLERIEGIADDELVNWFDVDGLSSSVSSGILFALDDPKPSYRWMRIVYTRASGTITLSLRMQRKGNA